MQAERRHNLSVEVGASMAYTTPLAVKAYLGIDGASDNALLLTLCSAAQKWIENRCERVFEAAADTTQYCDAIRDVQGPTLWFSNEVCAITSIVNGDGQTITSDKYVTEPRNLVPFYGVTLKSFSGLLWWYTINPENAIAVTGRYAYSITAPDDIAQAATRLVAYMYRQKDSQVFDTTAEPGMGVITVPQGIPRDVVQMLAPYKRMTTT